MKGIQKLIGQKGDIGIIVRCGVGDAAQALPLGFAKGMQCLSPTLLPLSGGSSFQNTQTTSSLPSLLISLSYLISFLSLIFKLNNDAKTHPCSLYVFYIYINHEAALSCHYCGHSPSIRQLLFHDMATFLYILDLFAQEVDNI